MRTLASAGATLRDAIFAINQLIAGRGNSTGSVTLAVDETETIIVGANVNENAEVFLFPKTASAAAELAAGTIYASISRIDGIPTVTITHANDSSDDRTFAFDIRGG